MEVKSHSSTRFPFPSLPFLSAIIYINQIAFIHCSSKITINLHLISIIPFLSYSAVQSGPFTALPRISSRLPHIIKVGGVVRRISSPNTNTKNTPQIATRPSPALRIFKVPAH